jgi:hypothetical protein
VLCSRGQAVLLSNMSMLRKVTDPRGCSPADARPFIMQRIRSVFLVEAKCKRAGSRILFCVALNFAVSALEGILQSVPSGYSSRTAMTLSCL